MDAARQPNGLINASELDRTTMVNDTVRAMNTFVVRAGAVFVTLIGAHSAYAGQTDALKAVLTTPHFAFHSDFAMNLNQALVADLVARRDKRPGLFETGSDKTCFDALPSPARDGWGRAVEYYRTNKASPGQIGLLRLELAGLVERAKLEDPESAAVLEAFARARNDAGPAYRACMWPAHDAANRAWIARLEPLLGAHARGLGEQLPKLFQVEWRGLPFRVDVVDWAGFASGNSASERSGRLHILVSSTHADSQGPFALELVFHEASHFLAQPSGPLSNALNGAAKATGVTPPRDILHQVHFFIAGEAVRRSFQRAGHSYTPYLYALNMFSDGFRSAVGRIWPAYLDGARTLDDAAAELVATFKP
jgi:hypothetical protein